MPRLFLPLLSGVFDNVRPVNISSQVPRLIQRLWAWFLAGIILTVIPSWALAALTYDQVDAIASQVTVVIAQGLQSGDIEARQEWNPGSGVLVAHEGNLYYALTALHVVRTRGTVYGIRTSDGEVHIVDDVDETDNIVPLGAERGEFGETISGLDLALVKFRSDREYPVATMGDSSRMEPGDRLVISGWPNPDDAAARRQRQSVNGQLTAVLNRPSFDGGYSFLYDNGTRRGMSGGPVLNVAGELVGIHGRGRGVGNNCGGALEEEPGGKVSDSSDFLGTHSQGTHSQGTHSLGTLSEPRTGRITLRFPSSSPPITERRPVLSEDNSCGMQTVHFITAAETLTISLDYADPPVDEALINAGLDNRDRADVIDDIYELFSFDVESMLRDQPSGGCGSVLLGEPCEGL
ncbi:MAG: serine protease [Cyanophyceae cyanobacterium]